MNQIRSKYDILINKYKSSDIRETDKGIFVVGVDRSAAELRVPRLNNRWVYISPNQVAQYDSYIYIPADQIPADDRIWQFIKPVSSKIMSKQDWLKLKTSYPYQVEDCREAE